MRRRVRLLVLLAGALLVIGLWRLFWASPVASDTQWMGAGDEPVDVVRVYRGADHCGWHRTLILEVDWERTNLDPPVGAPGHYVRDPASVGLRGDAVAGPFERYSDLPPDAIPTGYRTDGVELWASPSSLHKAVYLVTDRRVERWPALLAGCA